MFAQSPIPTSSTCDSGLLSVQQMDAVFLSLSPNLQSQFQSAHDTIMQSYRDTWYMGIDWIPFNPSCGTMYTIGLQADGLTAQMQSAEGQTPVGVPGPSQGAKQPLFPDIFGSQGTALLVVGGLVVVYLLIKR